MDLLYSVEASITEAVPVGLVPEGIRVDVHFEGRVAAGGRSPAHVLAASIICCCAQTGRRPQRLRDH